MRVLFQGDSVTDAGRDRENPANLGNGYPRYAAALLRERFPEREWEFLNLGISGNRTGDLLARWKEDCIDIQPDFLSILIGINDTWRAFDSNNPTTVEQFEDNYRRLLEDVKNHTHAKILMMEPFVLRDTPAKDAWRADLDPKIQVVRRLAWEYADGYVPLDGLFAAACMEQGPLYWTADGVHPVEAGAKRIAAAYVEAAARLL